jgi:uncharacterized protein (TIGR00251 family)
MSGDKASIAVRVQPNASANEVIGMADDVLRLKIAAPPVKGQANREIVSFLSKQLGVDKDGVAIVRGHTSRSKLVTIDGLSREEALNRLLG